MKFVILSSKILPGYDVCGPILSPAEYDIHLVLRWIGLGIDVREAMEDGSYRKLKHNDPKLVELLDAKIEKEAKDRCLEDLSKIKLIDEEITRLRYNYNWSLNDKNEPLVNFYIEKIHSRKNRTGWWYNKNPVD